MTVQRRVNTNQVLSYFIRAPLFSRPERTAQCQKDIQIIWPCLLLWNTVFSFHPSGVGLHTTDLFKPAPELHNSVSVATVGCRFCPSPLPACSSDTQHTCTCTKTHSHTHSLTTCNSFGPGQSSPGWIVQQEAMGAVLLPESKHRSRGHTSCAVRP